MPGINGNFWRQDSVLQLNLDSYKKFKTIIYHKPLNLPRRTWGVREVKWLVKRCRALEFLLGTYSKIYWINNPWLYICLTKVLSIRLRENVLKLRGAFGGSHLNIRQDIHSLSHLSGTHWVYMPEAASESRKTAIVLAFQNLSLDWQYPILQPHVAI